MSYCLNPACPSPQNPPTANFCQACGTALLLAGRYRIQSLLGESGLGRTFLALDTDSGNAENHCVVKQIYKTLSTEENRFQAEANRLRKLGEHPQIPRLIAAIENELGQFLVQQFAAGDNLASLIEKEGPWTASQVRSRLSNLIPVLQYVHSFDIIHRDIKPANIVLDNSSKNALPILVDFGAAKWIRPAPAQTVIGSAGYAAPEQSMGQATFASDIYSLGLTCLYLLTSIHPFSLYSTAEDRWVWQDYLPQPIEPRFAQVLTQMVARSLQQRYESMDQVALDLQFSQNPLRYAPKQLLTRARASIEPWKNALQPQPSEPALRPAVVTPQQWQRCYRITEPIGLTQAIAISPSLFATSGASGSIRLWQLPSGQLIHTFQRRRLIGDGHTAAVTAMQFHPDGRALYSASSDGTLKEWDTTERCLLNTLPTENWISTALVITADGRQLISANSDGKIVLWDIATLMPIAQLVQHQQRVNAIALKSVRSSDAQSNRYIHNDIHNDIYSNILASASNDGTVKLWTYPPNTVPQLAKTINLNHNKARKLPLSKSFGRQISRQKGGDTFSKQTGNEGAIALALQTPHHHHSTRQSTNQSTGQWTSQSTNQLIVATQTGNILIYTLDAQLNPSQPQELYQSPYPITAIALSTDGYLAIGSEDSILTIWRIETRECVAQLAHDWGIVALAFSPNGQTLITASADEIITVWQRKPD